MPLVTVSEVLRLALPPTTVVAAGAGGLGNAATWARLLRTRPTSLGRIEDGEIWLLSNAALQLVGDPRAVARMIRDMAQSGVVAFVTPQPLGSEVEAEADKIGTPVLQVASDTSLVEIEKSIVAVLVDRERAIAERVHEVYERLLATLVEDRGLELISDIVAEVTSKAVYLLDEHFQPTVQTGGDDRTAEALADVRRRYWEGVLGNVSERLIVLRPVDQSPIAAALRPLTLRGAVEGYLALVGPVDDFADFDHHVADRAASVLAIELAKQSAVVEARLRLQGDFLSDLLDNPASPDDALVDRARRLGYDLTRPHLVFVLRPREGGSGNGVAAVNRNHQRFVDAARRRLVVTDVTTLLREQEGSIQALMPCPSEVDPLDVEAGLSWVERLRASLEESLVPDSVPIVAGVGRTPGNGTTPFVAMREAIRAAEIAASMPGDSSASLHFGRLGVLRLIFHLADNPELRAFQRDVLGPLENSDATRRSEFVRTLDAFLKAGGNHMRAARDLNVHRNTLIYRLERIQELLGARDLEDPETRLNVQLALKIRAALGGSAATLGAG
ncbi:MAG TPA: helix-turn-helix domain-containing protein [Chloroflexota bacterium]|jgi:purine catabolism regulator